MAKKSFKADNPALQFISAAQEEAPAPKQPQAPKPEAAPPKKTTTGRYGYGMEHKRTAPSPAPPKASEPAEAPPPAAETKSRRLNLLLQPSVMDDLSKIAHMKKTSVNDLINTVMREYANENQALVEKYIEVFG